MLGNIIDRFTLVQEIAMATEEKSSSSEESQNRGLKVDLPTEFESVDRGRSLDRLIACCCHWY